MSALQDPVSAATWLLEDERRASSAAASIAMWQKLLADTPQDSVKEETAPQVLDNIRLLRNAATRRPAQALILCVHFCSL